MGIASQFDKSLYGAVAFDDPTPIPDDPTESADEISFDGYGLQNALVTTSDLHASGPAREISTRAYPRSDGAYVENAQWRGNVVTLKGFLTAASRASLEMGMDTMRRHFAAPAGILKITHAGVARYYDCYAKGMESLFADRQPHQMTVCPWAADFECFHPFARSLDRKFFSNPTSVTAAQTSIFIPHDGSAPTESRVYLMVTTAGSASKIRWENVDTGEAVEVGAAFGDGDYVQIDGEAKAVSVNGVAADYDGTFPTVEAGGSRMKLTVTGAGFSIAMSENHYTRFL